MKRESSSKQLSVIGWREIVALPEIGIDRVKAKIDTGARSSALHAFHVKKFEQQGKEMIRFQVHPLQRNSHYTVTAEAEVIDWREVKNSGGVAQLRPVIETIVKLGGKSWKIELTLTNRDEMGFRMLLGRQAVRQKFLVDAGNSFIQSSIRAEKK
ncbi:MAG: ATP-dependent zinc protease [Prochloraceae cyanobacterium]